MLAEQSLLAPVDFAIVGIYMLLTLAIGFVSARRSRRESSRSFFVAEKSLPWWVVGFTMVAASISAEQMLGEVGYARDAGLAVSNWDLGVYPALLLMVFVFLPLYLRSGVTTIPEYLERRYGRTTRLLFAVYTVFNNAFITLVMVVALGAKALEAFLGVSPVWGAGLLIAFTGIYTVYGGMSSVAWTDTFQCILLLAGGLTVFGAGLSFVPGGWGGLMDRMGQAHLDGLIRGLGDPVMPWPGLLLLMLSTNVWYCCTNQFYVQSCLGARTERHGRLGVVLTAFLGPVLTLCFAFPGYIANDLAQQGVITVTADANATYPSLVTLFLGPGLRGFVVAAVLGAIMSSIAAIVNATASVYTVDIHQRWFRPQATERSLIRVGQVVGFLSLTVAYPLTLWVVDRQYIFTYSQNVWCILAIPIMLVFTYGALWKRATRQAAVATFVVMAPFVAVPFVWGNTNDNYLRSRLVSEPVHLFNFAFGLWAAAAVFMLVVSLLTRAPDSAAVAPYVWQPRRKRPAEEFDRDYRWYQSVGFWSAVAGAGYVVIYMLFW